jgi:hypothetical protein
VSNRVNALNLAASTSDAAAGVRQSRAMTGRILLATLEGGVLALARYTSVPGWYAHSAWPPFAIGASVPAASRG